MTDDTPIETSEDMAQAWTPPQRVKCDGDHGGPACADAGCWHRPEPQTIAQRLRAACDDGRLNAFFITDLVALMREAADELDHQTGRANALHAMVNTPELVDFPKAVHLEAVHQEVRWGTEDREGKTPHAWFWLLSNLATRALEHHKNAERLNERAHLCGDPNGFIAQELAHHREKAAHHCITSAAALSHWHASVIGKATAMRPGTAAPAELQEATAC